MANVGKNANLIYCIYLAISCFEVPVNANDSDDTHRMMKSIVTKLDKVVDRLDALDNRVASLELQVSNDKFGEDGASAFSTGTYQFSEYGCIAETINLACPDNRTILVVDALFGQYQFPCTEACCAPHPTDDCTQRTEDTRPSDWIALKLLCDNRTSCQYEYLGVVIEDCSLEEMAAYMKIYYTCLPEDKESPVGFTAFAEYRDYTQRELVLFNDTLFSFGGHYQWSNSIFICPFDGIYLFSYGLVSDIEKYMDGYLMMDDVIVSGAYADFSLTGWHFGSNLNIVYCSAGTQVWIRARGGLPEFEMRLYGKKCSSFAGYLLYRYESGGLAV